MKVRSGLVVGLLVGAAPGTLHAQQGTGNTVPDAMPHSQFRRADEKLLSPGNQRELAEQIRKNPPAVASGIPPATKPEVEGDILVAAKRPRGSVASDIPPERTLKQLDLRAFGADNIGALLEVTAPQTVSNRGREDGGPLTLLNGRRVSSFAEIMRIPSEAIERMEIFPEELALKYGYPAGQKVVNIVTSPRFSSRIGHGTYLSPTEGDRETSVLSADYLTIRDDTRIGLGATFNQSQSLLEADRDVRQPPGLAAVGRSRTLLPQTRQATFNGVVSSFVLDEINATFNARFETNSSDSLVGASDNGPLRRDSGQENFHLGTTLSEQRGGWQWTLTANHDRTRLKILTDAPNTATGRDEVWSVDQRTNADLLLTGPVAKLPAGPVSVSLRGGIDFRDFESRSTRGGIERRAELSRSQGTIQFDLDLPLLSLTEKGVSALGTLSANANLAIERLSDMGSLRTFGYGLVWSPVEELSLIASATQEEAAPTTEQLGGPILTTPNVRTYDFVRREVVDVELVTGGNSNLKKNDRRVVRLGLNIRPFARTDLNVSADYVATRIDDPIAPFPIITPQIEAAFPERFERSDNGRLQRIDSRWLNFTASRQRQLRWGLNFNRPLGSVSGTFKNAKIRTYTDGEEARRRNPDAVFTRVEPGSALAQSIGNLTSRLFVSIYHNWNLQDAVRLRGGNTRLDLLDGGAIDFQGGRRRHDVTLQAGAFKRGLGARVTTTWRSGTTIRGSGHEAGNLHFNDFATVNLNLFLNLVERFGGSKAPKWMRGARATIGLNNLFNTRPLVRDGSGTAPLSYQPAYLDPLGRTLSVSFRKLF